MKQYHHAALYLLSVTNEDNATSEDMISEIFLKQEANAKEVVSYFNKLNKIVDDK